MILIARDRNGIICISDEILEEFNAECVNRFLEPIIDKGSIISSDGAK
ncbi:MAG: hypothetical protein ACTS73_03900 [Arsenophonus sp. NEOnobi-MAG3]